MAVPEEAGALVGQTDKARTGLGRAEVRQWLYALALRIAVAERHDPLTAVSGAPRSSEGGVKPSGDAGWGTQAAAGDGWDEPQTAPVAAPSPSRYC